MLTVLIADDDLGFLVWLGAILDEAGYQPVPAKTVGDAARLARTYPPNVLVINPEISGAAKLVAALCAHHPNLKVIALADVPYGLEGVVAVAARPSELTEKTADSWRNLIARAIAERPKV